MFAEPPTEVFKLLIITKLNNISTMMRGANMNYKLWKWTQINFTDPD